MRRGAPAPPPLRLGALLVLCSLSGLAVPVGSGSAAGELSAAALPPLLPLLPPPAALADSRAALHADLKDKTRAQLTRKMDAGEQLADLKAASFTAGSGVRLLPGHGRGQRTLHREPQGFRAHLRWEGGRALRRRGPGDISGGRLREGGQGSGRARGRRAARGAVAQRREGRGDLLHGSRHAACCCCTSPAA